ncbi:hypothetical protein OJ997_21330 [Solirubrobacter phytolaccae]|uniref:Uncharacterized protein n=1 Tax=Solirubrobacter phytolaccae TaxID=1404360 RepID=A0A9X3S925_9ACTN|nr:hypothetical protein [Solirubrobacter phytolaccae]MDA0182869.1 hypothetical protein [Solirubrobacter phytolaccae]
MIELGTVTAPSGLLVLTDMTLVKTWDEPEDDHVDLELEGPDAERAAAHLHVEQWGWNDGRNHDLPRRLVDTVRGRAEELTTDFDVTIRELEERVPAIERPAFAARNDVGVFDVKGAESVVARVPADRELRVLAMPDEHDDRRWTHVLIYLTEEEPEGETEFGMISLASRFFLFADAEALRSWDHEALWKRDGGGVREHGFAAFELAGTRALGCRVLAGAAGFPVRAVRSASDQLLALVIGIAP